MTEWTSLEALIAEHERDPGMAERLREARRRLGPILYPEGGPRYERMMRGLGPMEREPPHCPSCDCGPPEPQGGDPK